MTPRDSTTRDRSLDRRAFLERAALGGSALAASGFGGNVRPLAASAPSETAREDGTKPFELEEVTITALAEGMASGRWTARWITATYLARIDELDRRGPTLRSVIETNPDALDIAERLDRERREKGPRGPLHGVPILLKDNIATSDRMTTTAGSLALEGSIPSEDSFVAARLRAAGAVLLGKANLSEWANFRGKRSTSGWSARGGQCRNPYVLDRNPCGSSSGSAVATSANLVAAAIGTETNGSIVCPSSICGVVGVKPTVGLVSRSRIIPISHTQDTAGPMARTVRDAAIILGALAGADPADAATGESRSHPDYTRFLDAYGLKGARIGVSRRHFGFDPRVDDIIEAAIRVLAERGAVVVDPADAPSWREVGPSSHEIMLYEFKADLDAYLEALGPEAPVKSLGEVIQFNERHAERELRYFGQEILAQAQEKGPLTSPEYLEALATSRRASRDDGLDKVLDERKLDAIVAPTAGPAWVTDHVHGDRGSGGSSTPAAVAGYPNVTVPAGSIAGLPVGISFFGRAWSEPVLLRLAFAYEQATRHRRAPSFLSAQSL